MYKYEEICELIKLIGSTGVASVELEHAGSRVRIEGVPRAVAVEVPASPPASVAAAVAEVPAPASGSDQGAGPTEGDDGVFFVASPIVGTFYRAPSPEADPYVKVGDFVEKGQVLCIVEAMKLMNEIESDTSGTVIKVLPENAQPVEYGEHLFAVRQDN
ncbi:MAG: acetyl-CoA carboxylase biotin carboxyl carrier protein [Thermoanaerobaculales bacterium]